MGTTKNIEIVPLITGWMTAPRSILLEGETGTQRFPIPCYLIRHPKGLVLFDSGFHTQMADDPATRLGFDVPFEYSVDGVEDIGKLLGIRGLDPNHIETLICSHLHFDHAGGNILLPKATVVVQKKEWQVAHNRETTNKQLFPDDFDTGQQIREIDGFLDLFGDGTIQCMATPGHTLGHQSLKVQTNEGEFVLAADACFLKENFENLQLPSLTWDATKSLDSLKLLRRLSKQGAKIVAGHDERCYQGDKLVGF